MTPDSVMMNIMWQGLVDRQRIIREIPIDWTAQNINSNDILISSYTCKCTMNIQRHLDLKFLNLEWTIHQSLHPCRPGRKHHLSIVHIPPTSTSASAALEIDSCILALEEQLPSPYTSLYHVSIASVSNEGSAVSDTQVEFATEGCWRVCFWYTRT